MVGIFSLTMEAASCLPFYFACRCVVCVCAFADRGLGAVTLFDILSVFIADICLATCILNIFALGIL